MNHGKEGSPMPSNAAKRDSIESEPRAHRTVEGFNNFWWKIRDSVKMRIKEESWSDIGLDIAIILGLIGIGMFIRVILAYEFREQWGFGSSENLWNRNLLFNINNVEIRGFADFGYYYHSWITAWYNDSWYPYRWIEPTTVLDYYSYPPIFLYFLVLTWRPGLSNFWMAFPMVLTDAACAAVVYLILKNIIKNKHNRGIAIFGGVLMAIAPINVIYDGVYWLNPGPVTLLTMIAFYFAIKKKWWQSFFWLAIATMTKQNALFFTYPLFFVMLGEKVRNKSIRESIIESVMNVALFVGVCLLVSVPWIFMSPYQYGRHMLLPGRSISLQLEPVNPSANDCVSFAKSLQEIGFSGFILKLASFGNYSMLWMILSATIIAIYMFWKSYNDKLDGIAFFEWIAAYTIFTHIFMPRGVYKFYTAYYVPMILIALVGSFTYFTSDEKFLPIGMILSSALFLGFNIWLLVMGRWGVPFYLFMVAITIILFGVIRTYIRDQMAKDNQYARVRKFFYSKIGS